MKKRFLILQSLVWCPFWGFAQLQNSGSLTILAGTGVCVNGSVTNGGNALTNDGTFKVSGSLQNQATGTVRGNGRYLVENDFNNAGTFDAGTSTVDFQGVTNSAITSSNQPFHHVTLTKTAANLVLLDALTVNGTLLFNADNNQIQLGASDLTMGASGNITSFDDNEFVVTNGTGQLIRTVAAGTAVDFPIGFNAASYNPLILNQIGTNVTIGTRALEHAWRNGNTGATVANRAIDASWQLTEIGASVSKNLTMTAQWTNADELTGFTRSNCGIANYNHSIWNLPTLSASAGANPYTQTRSNLTQIGIFSVANSASALPLELLDFSAKAVESNVLLTWQTANELNFKHFEIQKSFDAQNWKTLATVPAHGKPNAPASYDQTDANAFAQSNRLYYRLKMVDFDNTFAYSAVRSVLRTGAKVEMKAFPNPATDYLYVQGVETEVIYVLYDILGREQLRGVLKRGENAILTQFLRNGSYFLNLLDSNQQLLHHQNIFILN
jgi:hypothetical protein